MPPRRRSERTKKEVEADVDTTEVISTPTRKRRRLNGADNAITSPAPPAPAPTSEAKAASPDSVETKDNDMENEPLTTDEIIANLKVARYAVNASMDFSNELQQRDNPEDRPAFAKIAGREWSYLLERTAVNFGRADRPGPTQDNIATTIQPNALSMSNSGASFPVSIDLGPSREVSRVHASIHYDSGQEKWILSVEGRNGLKLDDTNIARGMEVELRSGSVISIVGTQMMFILPNEEPVVHQTIKRQALADPGDASTDEETKKRRRNGRGFLEDRQFTEQDPFPPSSNARRTYHESASRSYVGQPGSTFVAAAFAGAPQPATPLAARGKDRALMSPSYPRGVMLESTEDIDYSQDNAKDLKPPHSYAQLIGQAILSSPDEMLTLANIYQFIRERYAFYRHSGVGWQNSIRHNLSLSKAFEKVARRTDEPGKGMKWKIVDDQRDEFIRKTLMNGRRGTARMGSSGPNSPAAGLGPSSHPGERVLGVMHRDNGRPLTSDSKIKSPRRSTTPPLSKIPQANEAFTPDRGPRIVHGLGGPQPLNGEQAHTPKNRRGPQGTLPNYAAGSSANVDTTSRLDREQQAPDAAAGHGLTDATAQSPPPYAIETGRPNHLVTPLVARQAPRLAPPSTAQAPSHFMQLSSPAPFWKYADLESSTPFLSPSRKRKNPAEEDRELASDTPDLPPQPSSPPVGRDLDGEKEDSTPVNEGRPEPQSPTKSRPVSRRQILSGRERATSSADGSSKGGLVPQQRSERAYSGNTIAMSGTGRPASTPAASGPAPPVGLGLNLRGTSAPRSALEDNEEEGIDLAKGFQKIGSFHQNLSQQQGAVQAP